MDKKIVAKAWIWSGLEDLFFGFTISFEAHRPYRIFNEILGLEKILKGYLFFHDSIRYSSLPENQARIEIETMAKKEYGHDIKKMLKKASVHLGAEVIEELKERDFDGFTGKDLIRAVEAGYMESRYPTLKPLYEQFKIKGEEIYRDPLESSGVTKFIYTVCREVLNDLRQKLDLGSVKNRFENNYQHMEQFSRFVNLAFSGGLDKYF